ncbi:hypothetical protein ACQ4PT_066761 [Festuca glaucescens]
MEEAFYGSCRRTECGVQYSTVRQVPSCPVPSPPRWPALVQVPRPQYRAVRTASHSFGGLPDPTCRDTGSCPAVFLVTGGNRSLVQSVSHELFPPLSSPLNLTDYLHTLSKIVPASNAYIKFLRGSGVGMLLEYVKEMPNGGTQLNFEIASVLGPLFFTWIIELIFPVILTYLVYEKQQKLKIMMKMHGLKDGPYWIISYAYFFALSAAYVILLVIFGSLIGLRFFTTNDYIIQFIFYLVYINLQIALAFFASSFFASVKLATVVGYIYIFGSGLLGKCLLQVFIEDTSFSSWIVVMEIIPRFSLYRGLYESSVFSGNAAGISGMKWANLSDTVNGMRTVLIIMVVEWAILLPLAFYWDEVSLLGGGVRKTFLISLMKCFEKKDVSFRRNSFGIGSKVIVEMENPDTTQEVG